MAARNVSYIARLIVKPKPSTLSESFLILHYVRTLGHVTRFAKSPVPAPVDHTAAPAESDNRAAYDVEFSSILGKLEERRKTPCGRRAFRFKTKANTFQPDAKDLDPYNVRGLLSRKPNLPACKFLCKLTVSNEKGPIQYGKDTSMGPMDATQEQDVNPYSGPFAVDRTSVFAKVYERLDTPGHMITGLLPKIDDDRSSIEYVDAQGRSPHHRQRKNWLCSKRKREKKLLPEVLDPDFSLMKLYEKHVQIPRSKAGEE